MFTAARVFVHNRPLQLLNYPLVSHRLQALLEVEEEVLLKEMETRMETMPERQAKMRERAKVLRERRESDRQLVVAQKLEQQFR